MPAASAASAAIVVLITCPDASTGENLAHALVEDGLAACVNLVPGLTSIYRWEGKLCREPEILLIAKTRRSRLSALQRKVKALHPYTVPEVIALPIVSGSHAYLAWVRAVTR